jgi:hypothetical protein
MIKKMFFLLVFSLSAKAQVSGIVTDGATHQPAPYVNIYLDDKRWVSAEEDGTFTINAKSDELLTFSGIGYETMTIKASEATHVSLQPATYALETVTVTKPKMTLEKFLGGYQRKSLDMYYTTRGVPETMGRYFPPDPTKQSTPFFKTVVIATKSPIKNAKFNLHILEANPDGTPGQEIAPANIIGTAKKGTNDTKIDLSAYRLRVPESGFFIAFEWLIIPENRHNEYSYTDKDGLYHEIIEYAPFFGTVRVEGDTSSWGFQTGHAWAKFKKVTPDRAEKFYKDFKKATGKDAPPFDYRHVDFAMKLILTN